MTTLDQLEETIQDFIDECSDHDDCVDCPCLDFCIRFETNPYGFPNPSEWKIEKKGATLPC